MAPDKTLARDIAALDRRLDEHGARIEAIRKAIEAARQGLRKTLAAPFRKRAA